VTAGFGLTKRGRSLVRRFDAIGKDLVRIVISEQARRSPDAHPFCQSCLSEIVIEGSQRESKPLGQVEVRRVVGCELVASSQGMEPGKFRYVRSCRNVKIETGKEIEKTDGLFRSNSLSTNSHPDSIHHLPKAKGMERTAGPLLRRAAVTLRMTALLRPRNTTAYKPTHPPRTHPSVFVADMRVLAQGHPLGAIKRYAFAHLANAGGGLKGLCFPLVVDSVP